jgi:hypothetical protein
VRDREVLHRCRVAEGDMVIPVALEIVRSFAAKPQIISVRSAPTSGYKADLGLRRFPAGRYWNFEKARFAS